MTIQYKHTLIVLLFLLMNSPYLAHATDIPRISNVRVSGSIQSRLQWSAKADVSYYQNDAFLALPLPSHGDSFGFVVTQVKQDGKWGPHTAHWPDPTYIDKLPKSAKTIGDALSNYYKSNPKWKSLRIQMDSIINPPMEGACVCLGTVDKESSIGSRWCVTTPVCSTDSPTVISCSLPSSVVIEHPPISRPGVSDVNKNVQINCTQSGNLLLSFNDSTVKLGSGISSNLSMNTRAGGLLPVVAGNNSLTITSNLHIPPGTSPGAYQGSTTLKLEYP